MPDDLAFLIPISHRPFGLGKTVSPTLPAFHTPSPKELMSRNGALVQQNKQLKETLARLMPKASPVMASLTPRQQQVLALVLAGQSSKIIADNLNISQRTVENHRAAIMRRTGATSLPLLVRLTLGVQ